MIINWRSIKIDVQLDPNSSHDEILIDSATFVNTGRELTDSQIQRIESDCSDQLYEAYMEQAISQAEYYADSKQDR